MALPTPASLRAGILQGLLTLVPELASVTSDDLQAAIDEARAEVERDLGCRLAATRIVSYDGAGAPSTVAGEEVDAPLDWPGSIPGSGMITLRPRVRPILAVESIELRFRGWAAPSFQVPLDWIRVDRRTQEISIYPVAGSVPAGFFPGTAGGFGGMSRFTPGAVFITYTAGLDAAGMKTWPQLLRMVELRSAIRLMGDWSGRVNPTALSSESADGLSQSRSSGYVFKDLEERYRAEADHLLETISLAWDGLMPMVL